MHLYGGTVVELARHIGDETFIAAAERRFTHLFGVPPSAQEVNSWRRSWPALVKILQAAGLDDLYVLLEYSLPATGSGSMPCCLAQARMGIPAPSRSS